MKPFILANGVDKASRPSISNVICILSSDTDTICQLNEFNTNSEAAMLSKQITEIKFFSRIFFRSYSALFPFILCPTYVPFSISFCIFRK